MGGAQNTSDLENLPFLLLLQLDTLYVSCGDQGAIEAMRAEAEKHGLTLVDKWGILGADNATVAATDSTTPAAAAGNAAPAAAGRSTALAPPAGSTNPLLDRVNQLNFDQRAIVDYAIMVAADVFLGIKKSTYSTVIAYDRSTARGYDVFEEFIFEGSSGDAKHNMHYSPSPALKGSNDTMLIVFSGFEFMDWYP